MTRFGVGPLFVAASAVYTVAALLVRSADPIFFSFPDTFPRWLQIVLGVALLAVGTPIFGWSLAILNRGFPEGRLFTGGPYRWCRHPIYGCWVVFNVPGIILLVGNWIGLAVPVLMWITLRLLVRGEERWLRETFGDAYRAYEARTPAVFPAFWLSLGRGQRS